MSPTMKAETPVPSPTVPGTIIDQELNALHGMIAAELRKHPPAFCWQLAQEFRSSLRAAWQTRIVSNVISRQLIQHISRWFSQMAGCYTGRFRKLKCNPSSGTDRRKFNNVADRLPGRSRSQIAQPLAAYRQRAVKAFSSSAAAYWRGRSRPPSSPANHLGIQRRLSWKRRPATNVTDQICICLSRKSNIVSPRVQLSSRLRPADV